MNAESRSLPTFEAGAVPVPFVIKGWEEHLARDTVWAAHAHPTHELLWNVSGASSTTVGLRTWMITPSVGVWMPAGVLHTGRAPAGTRLRAAQFDIHAVPALAGEPVAVEITPLLTQLLERLEDPGLGERSRRLTEEMILDVMEPAGQELLVQRPQGRLLRPVVAALEEDPADPRSLSEWAAELGVSSRTVTRAFRQETGLSFARWQNALRAHHAALLLGRGMSVEEVAYAVGYRSVSAFGAAFRRTTGLTPSRFHAR